VRAGARPCLIGVGNAWRHDDAVGLEVVARLHGRLDPSVERLACDGDLASLLLQWKDRSLVVVVDAMRSGAPAGTVERLEPLVTPHDAARLLTDRPRSTHAVGLAEAIALAQTLDLLPHRLVCYLIEVEDVSYGAGLSPVCHAAVERAVPRVVREFAVPASRVTGTAGTSRARR
jgi:hydrogenase maturation protease